MNKEALVKHAIKSMTGEPKRQEPKTQEVRGQEPIPKRKHWWNKEQELPLSLEEQKVLKKVKSRAHFLDTGLSCCCFRIGFDGLVGFVPVIGDFIGVLMAVQLVHIAMQLDLPKELISKMMFNIATDFAVKIGLVPLVGDVLDIMYKCNTKNAILLEKYLLKRREKTMNPS